MFREEGSLGQNLGVYLIGAVA